MKDPRGRVREAGDDTWRGAPWHVHGHGLDPMYQVQGISADAVRVQDDVLEKRSAMLGGSTLTSLRPTLAWCIKRGQKCQRSPAARGSDGEEHDTHK
jgi:hypothetical protein